MSGALSRLSPRRLLAPAACAVAFLAPFAVWLAATGDPSAYLTHSVPPGQTPYVLSKLFGLIAIVMFWFQCMAALARDTPVLRGFFRLGRRQHALLGAATFAAVGTHLILFIVATSMRTHRAALDLLIPRFDEGFFRTYVSLGVIAFWLLMIAMFAGWRRFKGPAHSSLHWRWAHRLGFAVFALGFLHGINVGSETRFGLMKYVYAFAALSLGAAVTSRLWAWAAAHRLRDRRRAGLEEGTSHVRTQ